VPQSCVSLKPAHTPVIGKTRINVLRIASIPASTHVSRLTAVATVTTLPMAVAAQAKARIAAASPTGAQHPGRANRAEIRTTRFAIA
jgi:hypothetical protein